MIKNNKQNESSEEIMEQIKIYLENYKLAMSRGENIFENLPDFQLVKNMEYLLALNNKLIDILTELTDKGDHNYIDWYEHAECLYCDKHFKRGEEQHADDCPIKRGRELLESLK